MDKQNGKRKAKRSKKYLGKDVIIDGDTGVVLAEYLKFRDSASRTNFAIMYLDDDNVYEALSGLGNQGTVWAYVLKHYDYKTGIFSFSSVIKEFMVQETKLSIGTIRSSIKGFVDSNLMINVIGSDYMVNPTFFYKWDWEQRGSMILMYEKLKEAKLKKKNEIKPKQEE